MVTLRRTGEADAIDPLVRRAAEGLADAALRRVQEPETGRVRVEDYLTVIAAMTGEAALVASGVLDIETTTLAPGSALFGDPINRVLSGDVADPSAVPPDSVFGLLVGELVPGTLRLEDLGSLPDLYRHVAAGTGTIPWGAVALRVPSANLPTMLPLQVAFELRPVVDAAIADLRVPLARRHIPCTIALAGALKQVAEAIDLGVAVRLALDVTFGTAKMVPMSRHAFADTAQRT